MATKGESRPLPHEIERQLEHMLQQPLLRSRARQSELLAFLVKGFLDGKNLKEKEILEGFFKKNQSKGEHTDVRATTSHMRAMLGEYYDGEGKSDPVIIGFPAQRRTYLPNGKFRIQKRPAGQAYTPVIVYNSHHDLVQLFQLGMHHLVPRDPSSPERALEAFAQVAERDTRHAAACVGAAEALLMSVVLGFDSNPADSVKLARDWAQSAIDLHPDDWHAHAVAGAAHFLGSSPASAVSEFAKAIACDARANRYPWYHAFLLATDRENEALELAERRMEERPDDAFSLALYGLFLYLARRNDEAWGPAYCALKLDRNCWLAYLVHTLHRLARRDEPDTGAAYQDMVSCSPRKRVRI